MPSDWGAHFDDFVDWLVDSAFFAALGYGTSQVTGESLWAWLGATAAIGATIDYVIDIVLNARAKTNSRANRVKRKPPMPANRKISPTGLYISSINLAAQISG